MFNHIGVVSLFVNDQARAKEFYTKTLGFELRQDAPLYPGSEARWVWVAPPGATTEMVLYVPDENWEHYRQVVGKSQCITFDVSDIQALVAEMKSKGINFTQEPDPQPWGIYAQFEDPDGNTLLMVEQPKG